MLQDQSTRWPHPPHQHLHPPTLTPTPPSPSHSGDATSWHSSLFVSLQTAGVTTGGRAVVPQLGWKNVTAPSWLIALLAAADSVETPGGSRRADVQLFFLLSCSSQWVEKEVEPDNRRRSPPPTLLISGWSTVWLERVYGPSLSL